MAFLSAVTSGRTDSRIEAEVLQEILHRYRALRRWSEGRQVYDRARQIVLVIETVDCARQLLDDSTL